MDPNMDPKKRLHLNFGGLGGGQNYGDRNFTPTNERVFPTTPSAFPHSVFQGSHPANDYVGAQVQQNNYAGQGGGYFPTGAYQAQYSTPQSPYAQNQGQFQGQYQTQYQQQGLATPQPSYQQRQPAYNSNDPTSGLARQFSNQNLGAPQRQPSPLNRQPSPNSRFFPNGQPLQGQATRNQQSYVSNQQNQSSLLTPATADGGAQSAMNEVPPEKNPDKYSANISKRTQGLHVIVESFFRENIKRARDRNLR